MLEWWIDTPPRHRLHKRAPHFNLEIDQKAALIWCHRHLRLRARSRSRSLPPLALLRSSRRRGGVGDRRRPRLPSLLLGVGVGVAGSMMRGSRGGGRIGTGDGTAAGSSDVCVCASHSPIRTRTHLNSPVAPAPALWVWRRAHAAACSLGGGLVVGCFPPRRPSVLCVLC